PEPPAPPAPARRDRGPLGATHMTPVVAVLIGANVVVYLLELGRMNRVIDRFGMYPVAVHLGGQWYRLVTSAFLHASFEHILFNMVTLAIVGPPVEAALGRTRFAALYLLAALGGSVGSYLLSPALEIGVGASGAIFGLMGGYFVLARRRHWDVTTILALIGINLVLGFAIANIDWRAHLGGLVTGALVVLGMAVAAERPGRLRWAGALATAAVALVALVLLSTLPPGHVNL
ncbi:MAG: rhomboid family intramembrane serine protease, partial [Acidimicrobiales bacterium]